MTLFFLIFCKSCKQNWKDAILKQATEKALTKEVFIVISIMFYKIQYKTAVANAVRTE
jgi:hypothetical protein